MEKYNTKFIQACKDNDINLIKNIITYTPKTNHLELSLLHGNIDIIQLILDTHEHYYYDIQDLFENFYKINNFNFDNFNYIIDVYIKKYHDYEILKTVRYLLNKDLNMIDWYFGLFNKYNLNYNKFIDKESLIFIITSSNINDLNKLSNYISFDNLNYQQIIHEACLKDNLDAVKFIYNLTNNINLLTQKALYHSCYKDLELVKWLIDTNPNYNLTLDNYKAFRLACMRGKYDIAKYLYEKTPEVLDKLRNSYELCERIVLDSLYNSLDLCKWLYSFNIYEFDIYSLYDVLIDCKLTIDILEWLYSVVPDFINDGRFIDLFNHIWYNNLDVAKWLYNKRLTTDTFSNIDINNDNYHLFVDSCNSNNKDVLEWLLSLKPAEGSSGELLDNTVHFNKILKTIIKHNCHCIDIFVWLYELKYKDSHPANIQKLIKLSLKDSTIEIYRYLTSKYNNIITFNINLDDFKNICLRSSMNIINIINQEHSYIKEQIDSEYITNLFNECLKKDVSIMVCKWLINEFTIKESVANIIINNETIHNAFLSCNRKLIKFILSLKNDFDLTYNNNIILNDLCKLGYLNFNIIKYLFRLDRNINLRIDNDILLKCCFRFSDYHKTEWLLKKIGNVELNSSYDQFFRDFCNDNEHKFVKLMNKLNPNRYKYIIDKDFSIICKISRIINETKNIKTDDLCMICLTNKSDIITQCDHIYCYDCIDIWLNINKNCPYCRSNIIELYKIVN